MGSEMCIRDRIKTGLYAAGAALVPGAAAAAAAQRIMLPMENGGRELIAYPGKPYGCEVKIMDRQGNEVPRRTPGEILVRGGSIMKEYYKDPVKTAEALDPDGWFHTGDLGYMDEDDFVFITGRLKELIIKGGENIAPREIDEALLRHPSVLDAAAVGIPDEHYGQQIMVCAVLKPGHDCSEEELRRFCRAELGDYKTPAVFRFLDELPRGPSGKVQRLKLLDPVAS